MIHLLLLSILIVYVISYFESFISEIVFYVEIVYYPITEDFRRQII